MDHRTPRALAAAAALALTLGACADAPTSPAARIASADQPAHTVSASGATLIPNSVRYRYRGGKPATGRSGAAILQAFALLGKDGVTELDLETVAANPWEYWMAGIMTRAQIKAMDVDSSVMFVQNLNNIDTPRRQLQFRTLARGHYLQVQAGITFADPHRTDVVTVTERVKLRPDLAPRLEMAPQVPSGQPVPIYATISELNGDVGATTGCLLWVDGWIRDMGSGAWVDAGDTVTCMFSVVFETGSHQVQVEVVGQNPADWDTSNDRSAVVQVEAVGAPRQFIYHAAASAVRERNVYETEWNWINPAGGRHGEGSFEHGDFTDTEHASISGWTERALPTGELSLEVSQSTGGRVLHSDAWTAQMEIDGCTSRVTGGASFLLCNTVWGSSWFTYERLAGSVTYHSREYSREWDDVTGDEFYYHQNWESVDNYGPLAGYADDYAFHVHASGEGVSVTANSSFPLQSEESAWSTSDCYPWEDSWDGFIWNACYSQEHSQTIRSGTDSNDTGW
jgi:hypothetical protein